MWFLLLGHQFLDDFLRVQWRQRASHWLHLSRLGSPCIANNSNHSDYEVWLWWRNKWRDLWKRFRHNLLPVSKRQGVHHYHLLYRCYMPNHWVALVSTVLPIILCLMCMVLLFSHACIYWGQWEQYDDMYYYSHNYRGSQDIYITKLCIYKFLCFQRCQGCWCFSCWSHWHGYLAHFMPTLAKCIYSYCLKYSITYRCVCVCVRVCVCVCVCVHACDCNETSPLVGCNQQSFV